jgi:hypothetical protein
LKQTKWRYGERILIHIRWVAVERGSDVNTSLIGDLTDPFLRSSEEDVEDADDADGANDDADLPTITMTGSGVVGRVVVFRGRHDPTHPPSEKTAARTFRRPPIGPSERLLFRRTHSTHMFR